MVKLGSLDLRREEWYATVGLASEAFSLNLSSLRSEVIKLSPPN